MLGLTLAILQNKEQLLRCLATHPHSFKPKKTKGCCVDKEVKCPSPKAPLEEPVHRYPTNPRCNKGQDSPLDSPQAQ